MKLPRDCGATQLVRALQRHGYEVIRQEGSHIRLGKILPGTKHVVTVPNHNPIKIGTLSAILKSVAVCHSQTVAQLLDELDL